MIHDRWDNRPQIQIMKDSLSQFINSWFMGGMADESISGRCWRNTHYKSQPKLRWRILKALAELIFYPKDKGNHCYKAFWQDIYRCKARYDAALPFIRTNSKETFNHE